jgi:hypothetical protein
MAAVSARAARATGTGRSFFSCIEVSSGSLYPISDEAAVKRRALPVK